MKALWGHPSVPVPVLVATTSVPGAPSGMGTVLGASSWDPSSQETPETLECWMQGCTACGWGQLIYTPKLGFERLWPHVGVGKNEAMAGAALSTAGWEAVSTDGGRRR